MLIAAAAANTSPWWGVPVIAGAFAILGVLATQMTTWLLDRRRSRREDLSRWHGDRRRSYAAYVAAMDEVYMRTSAYLTTLAQNNESAPARRSAALDAVRPANICRQDLFLLASKAVRDAADHLWWLPGEALGPPDTRSESQRDAAAFRSGYQERLEALLDAMRRELGADDGER
ncbi:hypothetical protein [Actinoplanes sp. NPDC049681]|uniref:hypothetical protein n=1 Tax=Actinoplanes sp. NPDC049681 TaxID=3363905 RepID=UPI0037A76A76